MLQFGFFPKNAIYYNKKRPMGTFHEVLPGNSVFIHVYYTGTIEIQHIDQTIEFSIENYIINNIFLM